MMDSHPLKFWHRGQLIEMQNVPPTRTLLQLLREDLHLTGTKEGCNEGDCGACTVVLRESSTSEYKAVNSCIRMAHSIDGMELTVVEDLSGDGALHPCQQAMLECHGSQCGFCTPGFVMSLYALHENAQDQPVSRTQAQQALSGNLCRCTGYRPILDAAVRMQQLPKPQGLLQKNEHSEQCFSQHSPQKTSKSRFNAPYLLPKRLSELLAMRKQFPQAQLVAGCTDVGLWVNKGHQQFAQILDVTRVQELRHIERYTNHIAIGAAVSLEEAFTAMVVDRPQLQTFASRFAGLPVRNSGTLGGNIANGSPIGDSMPLLIALKANIVLMSVRGHREMPLEQLYRGYRQNVMAPDEVLAWIKVPLPTAHEFSRVYKISKRYDDDISAVCLAISAQRDGAQLQQLSIGVGGVAATPVRATKTEALCADLVSANTAIEPLFAALKSSLQQEFSPISDMRASSAYRREMLAALLDRFALELQGEAITSLESWEHLQALNEVTP